MINPPSNGRLYLPLSVMDRLRQQRNSKNTVRIIRIKMLPLASSAQWTYTEHGTQQTGNGHCFQEHVGHLQKAALCQASKVSSKNVRGLTSYRPHTDHNTPNYYTKIIRKTPW